jgi:hypothetical protein
MADTMEETLVTGSGKNAITKPPSAWKVGLAVGGMTLNPLLGAAAGIAAHFRNKSYLEQVANAQQEKDRLRGAIQTELNSGNTDPDEKRLLEFADGRRKDAYERIASGDSSGYQILEHVQATVEQLIGGDISARKQEVAKQADFQRDLIGTAAKGYRQDYQDTLAAFNGMNKSSQQILDLVADPNFDPNKPLNKAHLAELLSMGGLMFKDTPDLMDGLTQGVSAVNGIAGGIVGGISTIFKSQNFKVSAEDYNRLALNAQKYAKIYAQQKFEQLGSQGANLNKQGVQWGVIPSDSNIADYISGGEKELRMTPNTKFTGGYQDTLDMIRRPETPTSTIINPTKFPGAGRGGSGPSRPTN